MNWLATRTWQDYADSSKYRLSLDEETTTDRNLLELRRSFPDLHVHKYTRQREHIVGADWEWWIGSDSEGWLCLRIQAKRVFATCAALSTYRVASLHSVGDATRSSVPRYLEHSMPWSELFTIASTPDANDLETELDLLHESVDTLAERAIRSSGCHELEL